MIKFEISAPSRLSLFGEHAVKYNKDRKGLIASVDLRTTLTFKEYENVDPHSNITLIIQCPSTSNCCSRITPLVNFINFYNDCIQNIELLQEKVLEYTNYAFTYISENQRIIVQIFYYLLICIIYEEQIKIKPFIITLFSGLIFDEKYVCPASSAVCIAAGLLQWSRMQKSVHANTFHLTDLEKICSYAARCKEISSECGLADVTACTYGSIVEYKAGDILRSTLLCEIPTIEILLVVSKQMQTLEAKSQGVSGLGNSFAINHFLFMSDTLTSIVYNAFQNIVNTYRNIQLSNEERYINYVRDFRELTFYISDPLLLLLQQNEVFYKIYLIALKYKCHGKYTDIGNSRYAYIWCQGVTQILSLMSELTEHDFNVWPTTLATRGVRIIKLN